MTTLYKTVGPSGEPIHGGSGAWPLPAGGEPGAWREETGEIEKCRRGLHLTDDPARWWSPGCRVFVAEAEGIMGTMDDDRKVVCRRARLVREVTDHAELAALRIFVSGTHEAKAGVVVAHDSASVWAYDSASVRAYGSASVRAYGSASVEAHGSASVVADDSASVRAYGSASVRAYGSASVRAYGSASVEADGSASVRAYDSASVRAYGSASVVADGSASVWATDAVTVVSSWGKPGVRIDKRAVWIERGEDDAAPVVHVAKETP